MGLQCFKKKSISKYMRRFYKNPAKFSYNCSNVAETIDKG